MTLEWAENSYTEKPNEVAIDPETTETIVVQMAHAIVAVVRPVKEVDDER